MGDDNFNKFCFFIFRLNFVSETNKELGKVYSVIIFCLDHQYNNEELLNFSADIKKYYSEFIYEEKEYFKIQNYRIKENIAIQYYDPIAQIDIKNPVVPKFYTSFSEDGLSLNSDKNNQPTFVKFSFRFDQLIDCIPSEVSTLKKNLPEKVSALYRDDKFCLSYLVIWDNKPARNMFCTRYNKVFQSLADIKIFESTMYYYCMREKTEFITNFMKSHNNDFFSIKLNFLEQIGLINFLKEIDEKDLLKYLIPTSNLYKHIDRIKAKAKEYREFILKIFGGENKFDSSGRTPSCKEILKNSMEQKEIKKGSRGDIENVTREEEKLQSSNEAQALKMINRYKYMYCKEIEEKHIKVLNNSRIIKKSDYKTIIDSKSYNQTINYTETEISSYNESFDEINVEENLMKEGYDIRKIAMVILRRCKGNLILTPSKIMELTKIILANRKIFEKAFINEITMTKQICLQLKDNPVEALRKLEKKTEKKYNKFKLIKQKGNCFSNECGIKKKPSKPEKEENPLKPEKEENPLKPEKVLDPIKPEDKVHKFKLSNFIFNLLDANR